MVQIKVVTAVAAVEEVEVRPLLIIPMRVVVDLPDKTIVVVELLVMVVLVVVLIVIHNLALMVV